MFQQFGPIKYQVELNTTHRQRHNLELYKNSKHEVELIIEEVCHVEISHSILYQLFKQKHGFIGFETLTQKELEDRYRTYLIRCRQEIATDENIDCYVSALMEQHCSPYLLLQSEMTQILNNNPELKSLFTIETENEYDDYPIFKIMLLFPEMSDVNYITQHLTTVAYQTSNTTDNEITDLMSPITIYLQMSSIFV